MRSFSLAAFAALFLVVAVSAAPHPEIDVEDVVFNNMDGDITFEKLLKALKCMRDVIGNVIGDGEYKTLYEEYKQKAEMIVKNDLMKCRDMQGSKLLCIVEGLHKVVMVYNEFFMKLGMKNKDLVTKIQKELKTKCAHTEMNIEDVVFNNMDGDLTFEKLLKALKCMRDVIGNVVGNGEYKTLYEEYKQKAEMIVKNDLMKCRDMQGSKLLCIVEGLHKVVMVYNEFFMKLGMKNKDLVTKIQNELKQKCAHTEINYFVSQQTAEVNIEDVVFDNLKGDITFEKLLKALKCMRDVIGNVIGNGEYKTLYEEYKQKAEVIVKNDLMKCRDMQGSKLLCIVEGLHKVAMVYNEFFMKLGMKNKDLMIKIQKELQEKCAHTEMNFFAADTYAPTMREQVLCQIKALGEASMKNGMTTEWKEYEPKFMQHMDSWKQCDTITEKMKKLWCNIKQGASTFGLFFKYTKTIAVHPNFQKFTKDFTKLVKEKCTV